MRGSPFSYGLSHKGYFLVEEKVLDNLGGGMDLFEVGS